MEDKKLRIDKWLWAVRMFKTRSLASAACDQGRIQIDEQPVKASRTVRVGDHIYIKRTGITIEIEVIELIDNRVGAKRAIECFKDLTPPEKLEEYRQRAKRITIYRDPGTGRPTKKERRDLDLFTDFYEEE